MNNSENKSVQKICCKNIRVYSSFAELFAAEDFKPEKYSGYHKFALELAGRDSIAACLKVIRVFKADQLIKGNFRDKLLILPVSILHSGFSHSSNSSNLHNLLWNPWKIFNNYNYLKNLVTEKNILFLNPLILDCSQSFNELILRTMGIVQKKYSAFTPCVPCHLFLHLFRTPILKHYNIDKLISGERILHNSRVKLNQTTEVLDFFRTKLCDLGIDLIQPLIDISDDCQIDEILEEFRSNYLKKNKKRFEYELFGDDCIFSRNSEDENDQPVFNPSHFAVQLKEFYFPKMLSFLNKS